MKKLFAIALALVLALSTLTAMADEVIYVATNPEYPPFESVADDGVTIVGYDVDMFDAIAKKAGFKYEFEPMAFDAVVSAVATNPNTVGLSGISITDERKMSVNFSLPYINAGVVVIAKTGSGFKTTDDLKGKVIGVQLGTTSDFEAVEITGIDNVAQYNTFLNAIMDLQGNKIDAVFIDKPVGEAILASLNDASLEMLDIEIVADWYGIAINKDNVELQQKIDAAITELEAEGFFTELNKKYFGGEEEAAAE